MVNREIGIEDVLLGITNFCLGSCVYCNLKALKTFKYDKETSVGDIERLLKDPLLDDIKNIHITGGEPVLSPKTYEIFKLLCKLHPNIKVNMPVSGFFPQTTYRYCKKLLKLMPQLRVDISLDGPRGIHEKTRGKDTWETVMSTIYLLHSIKDFKLQLQFTVMESNCEYLDYVWDLAKELDLGFILCTPIISTRFAHKENKQREYSQEVVDMIDSQVKDTWCKIRPINKRVWKTQKASWEDKEVLCDCNMGRKSIDIDPFGNVYPCMCYNKDRIFGNIRSQSLTEMFNQENANRIFKDIENRKCQPCLMTICPHKKNFTIDGKKVGL